MVEPKRGEDHVPDQEETQKQEKILHLDPHGQKITDRDASHLIRDYRCGHDKGKGQDQQIKKRKRFKKDLTPKRSHGISLLGPVKYATLLLRKFHGLN